MPSRRASDRDVHRDPLAICGAFANAVQKKFAAVAQGHEEDQLRSPTDKLVEELGSHHQLTVVSKDESPLSDQLGRPDFAVTVSKLLCGYVELKAPGTGADPSGFKGHNQKQWERFKHLPNLVYTDGNCWSLFRTGKVVRSVTFPGAVEVVGSDAIDESSAGHLSELFLDFFHWEPLVPSSAKQLAELVAPLCRMLRDDVLEAIQKRSPAILHLTRDWRRYLFPKATDEALADSYAQTVLFALLLARSDGSDTLFLDDAVKQLSQTNGLLARALQVLVDPQLSDDIGASLSLIQRVVHVVPPGTMTKGRRDPWLHFYEDFLAEYDPELRRNAGAYYTPVEVVQAQVRLVDELLRGKFGKSLGFADGDVATLDPAVGTGTYLLGIVEHAMERVRVEEGQGAMRGRAENLAKQLHGLEIMVGPYAVAALRLTRAFHEFKAKIPRQGVGVLLSNTLESPNATMPEFPLMYRKRSIDHVLPLGA